MMNYKLRVLGLDDIESITQHFVTVFTDEPWNDNWDDKNQLNNYMLDLVGQGNSLTLGYYCDHELVGLSMGHLRHWFTGTEYFINELCILQKNQGQGVGTQFMKDIEDYLLVRNIARIVLTTDRSVPAYHFYIKNGYKELSEIVFFYKGL